MNPSSEREAWVIPSEPELFRFINSTPLVASLLYDINLLPEQISDAQRWGYMLAVCEHMRAAISTQLPRIPLQLPAGVGWKLVPVEPTSEMLDRAVAFALCVSLSKDYGWSEYMRDVWLRMLSAVPGQEGGE